MPQPQEPDEWAVFDDEAVSQQPNADGGSSKQRKREARAAGLRRDTGRGAGVVLGTLVLAGMVAVIIGAVLGVNRNAAAEPVPLLQPTQSATPEPTSTPGQGFPRGDGPQAAKTAVATPQREAVSIPEPSAPAVDPSNPETTAKAWASAYLSRSDEEYEEWRTFLPAGTPDALIGWMEEQSSASNFPLAGKWPTTVTDTRFTEPAEGAPVDTPVRWSRTADVDVLAGDGSTTTITFALTLYQGADGWVLTNLEQKFWVVK